MSMNPDHRYAILDASKGARLIETAATEERAINRANSLTWKLRHPIEVKDRQTKDRRGLSVVIYETSAITSGDPRGMANRTSAAN